MVLKEMSKIRSAIKPIFPGTVQERGFGPKEAKPQVPGELSRNSQSLRSLQLAKGGRKQDGQRIFAWASE
jgi:hypothetical protein